MRGCWHHSPCFCFQPLCILVVVVVLDVFCARSHSATLVLMRRSSLTIATFSYKFLSLSVCVFLLPSPPFLLPCLAAPRSPPISPLRSAMAPPGRLRLFSDDSHGSKAVLITAHFTGMSHLLTVDSWSQVGDDKRIRWMDGWMDG